MLGIGNGRKIGHIGSCASAGGVQLSLVAGESKIGVESEGVHFSAIWDGFEESWIGRIVGIVLSSLTE